MNPAASQRTLEQAAEWFALLRSGEATEADRAGWRAWLDGPEEHRAAWASVERIGSRFEPLRASPDPRAAASSPASPSWPAPVCWAGRPGATPRCPARS
jgi:transmembrane sensor